MSDVTFHFHPRKAWTKGEFLAQTGPRSIALDGMVRGGPFYDEKTLHANYDHHEGVVREATMSTCMQVYFAIKGGVMERFGHADVYLNDPDQDTSLSGWLLSRHKQFCGIQSQPLVSRLLTLTDRLDITGGAFPMSLDDALIRQHAWVFGPYSDLRKSGALANANAYVMHNAFEAVGAHLDKCMMGEAEERELDTRHEILHVSDKHRFTIVDEIGGNEARYLLFSKGKLDGYVSLVARRDDGRFVYTIGRRSQYIDFPVRELYGVLNRAENLPPESGWNGSDLIGGSNRQTGSGLNWQELRDVVEDHLDARQAA